MPKRSSKPPDDENMAASEAVARLTRSEADELRSQAAAILGSMGGKKGGPARAKALSRARRSAIAKAGSSSLQPCPVSSYTRVPQDVGLSIPLVCLSAQAYIGAMNKLTVERRIAVVQALVEGNSIRATCRMTGTAKGTVLRLLAEIGEACAQFHDRTVRNIKAKRLQADEIWSFCHAKARNVPAHLEGTPGIGDIWTWVALDADTKLAITYLVGQRDAGEATVFMRDLVSRLARRPQLTTDGFPGYLEAVEKAFGWNGVDYAMLIKQYGAGHETDRGYSPPVCTGAIKTWVMGKPVRKDVSTSYVERQNLTMRMQMRRFTRLTNAFSKKADNHAHAVALHFAHYNFCRVHQTLTKAAKGVYQTPAMAAGLTDRVWTVADLVALLDQNLVASN